ncbi:hypothetical protein, partial [Sulfuracidifex metallicus]|uniref:hypothetical protein n=1 Tax=Sulfuracidifex metallicus TaxID=47303 RepID=UPI000AF16924
ATSKRIRQRQNIRRNQRRKYERCYTFAYNLLHPAAILPYKDKILVADAGFNAILDITEGGDESRPKVVAKISGPYGLTSYHDEIYSTFNTQVESGIVKISKNGEIINYVTNFPAVTSIWSRIYKLLSGCNNGK